MPFKYLQDIATADAAFEVEGETLEELFKDAAVATFEVMVDTRSVEPEVSRDIRLTNDSIEGLLLDWLSELVYLKDAESVLFNRFDVTIIKNNSFELKATATGDNIDREKHILRSDVKAVTHHLFELKKVGEKWRARVILDI